MRHSSIAVAFGVLVLSQGFGSDDSLDDLLIQYRELGLPLPSEEAELVLYEHGASTSNGVRTAHVALTFKEAGPTPDRVFYWLGCERVSRRRKEPDTAAAPTRESVAATEPWGPDYNWKGFPTFSDLALAIQCKARGWDDLATGLHERSQKRYRPDSFSQRPLQPRDDRNAIALLAWNYRCNQFAKSPQDRASAVDHLRRLLDRQNGLDGKANRTILSDMEKSANRVDIGQRLEMIQAIGGSGNSPRFPR
jgi:hypothetical protein